MVSIPLFFIFLSLCFFFATVVHKTAESKNNIDHCLATVVLEWIYIVAKTDIQNIFKHIFEEFSTKQMLLATPLLR